MSRAALAKVHIAKKELGLDDAAYRAMLERITGRTSAKDCTEGQLGKVLDELKAKGWKPTLKVVSGNPGAAVRRGAPASSPVAKKARAMWISLHQLGAVRDPSESALEAFGRRQLGAEKLQWANQSHGYRLIEALKAMAEREGWDQDVAGLPPGTDLVKFLRGGLVKAQAKKLGRPGSHPLDYLYWSHPAIDRVIIQQAELIHAAQAAQG